MVDLWLLVAELDLDSVFTSGETAELPKAEDADAVELFGDTAEVVESVVYIEASESVVVITTVTGVTVGPSATTNSVASSTEVDSAPAVMVNKMSPMTS